MEEQLSLLAWRDPIALLKEWKVDGGPPGHEWFSRYYSSYSNRPIIRVCHSSIDWSARSRQPINQHHFVWWAWQHQSDHVATAFSPVEYETLEEAKSAAEYFVRKNINTFIGYHNFGKPEKG